MSTPKLVIVAGEESGDAHAANLVRELTAWNSAIQISGIGGPQMEAAGVSLISDLARFGVTGISEVIRHAWTIKKAFNQIKSHLETVKPDLLILVDYPGFNLRLAKFAKHKLGIRVFYYISPQIWAWKANRINTIRACVDHMAVIFPFEKSIYQKAHVPVSFVGHPLVEKLSYAVPKNDLRMQLDLPQNKRLIALLPGSRINEINQHLPVLIQTIEQLNQQASNLHFVIPIATTLNPKTLKSHFKTNYSNLTLISGRANEVMACSDCVVVASGTASLECALLEKPMCIVYKTSRLTYIVATKLLRINYIGLCNVLQNKMIVPELLQDDFNPIELTKTIIDLLNNEERITRMTAQLKQLKQNLSANQADCTLSELIKNEIENPQESEQR